MGEAKRREEVGSQYKHVEAFALMQYGCATCHHFEIFWNSRDGVTPFAMQCPSCGGLSLQHVNFRADRRVVDHKLRPGQRYFRDGTPEEARAIMRHRIRSLAAQGHVIDEERQTQLMAIASDPDGREGEFQKGWPMVCREPDFLEKILAGGTDG